jgi:magnesium transporter
MATCRLYREGKIEEEDFDPARVSDLLQEPDTLVWLDMEDPSERELAMLQEEFGLHPLAVEDARHQEQRPKVEVYERFFFIVLYGLDWGEEELTEHEIHVFVGHGYLITLRYSPTYDLSRVRHRWERRPELTKEGGGYLLHALLDEVVDGYFGIVERFEDLGEGIEEEVFAESPPADLQERIFQLKKRLIQFRRVVIPLREVLDLLSEEVGVVTAPLQAYYRDVADHVIRTIEFIDNVRDLLTAALEAHLSQVSNRLNVVMKQITSWAAIILLPTLIAGIYGMNFRHMPELIWRFGYLWALGLMSFSAGMLYLVFKRRGWL